MNNYGNQYIAAARAAAKRYGLDESTFVRQLAVESVNFDEDVIYGRRLGGSGEVGIAQFMPATSSKLAEQWDWDFNPADPFDAIEASARYMAQLQKKYGGDIEKALAAYNAGEPAVNTAIKKSGQVKDLLGVSLPFGLAGSRAPGLVGKATDALGISDSNWRNFLPNSTRDNYLPSIFQKDASGNPIAPSAAVTDAQRRGPGGGNSAFPKLGPEDFFDEDLETGSRRFNAQAYAAYLAARDYDEDRRLRLEDRDLQRSQAKRQDLASYLDDVIAGMGADVAAGNLDLKKAQGEFDRRMKAFDSGADLYTNLLGYSLPVNAKYAPGREPGGFYEKIGLAPAPASGQIIDPFAMALEPYNQTPNLMNLQTPNTVQTMVQQAYAGAGLGPGGFSGTATPVATQSPAATPNPFAPGPGNPFQAAIDAQLEKERAAAMTGAEQLMVAGAY